jgi:hypothetical protein
VTLEKRLVHRDVLQALTALVGFNFKNSIDQEHRVPMRQEPHDLVNVQTFATFPFGAVYKMLG